MILYQVKDWDANFENNKSREREECSFLCVPNGQDGHGFIMIMNEKDGASIYGIFNLIIGACSQQGKPREGWLTQDGHPTGTTWTPRDLAIRWRRKEAEIRRALEFLSSPTVGWLVRMEVSEDGQLKSGAREVPAECPPGALEEKRREEKEKNRTEPPPFYSEARIVLHWLNEKSASHFREVDANLSAIAARLKSTDGDIEGIKLMVSRQCQLWKGNPKTEEWLRPSTLFGVENFEKYYGARNKGNGLVPSMSGRRRDDTAFLDPNLPDSPV